MAHAPGQLEPMKRILDTCRAATKRNEGIKVQNGSLVPSLFDDGRWGLDSGGFW